MAQPMLMTKDVVKVADKVNKDKTKYHKVFDRPYLSFGQSDELDTEESKISTSDNGEVKVTLTSPKEKTSKHSPVELYKSAIEFYRNEQEIRLSTPAANGTVPTEEEKAAKRVDPLLLMIKDADNGLISRLRMDHYNSLVPKEINFDKALVKMAQALQQKFPGKYPELKDAVQKLQELGMA